MRFAVQRRDAARRRRSELAHGALIVACIIFVYCPTAHAYLDPGTGSALLYVITGLMLSAYFGARGLYYKALERLFRVRFKNRKCRLALHSEDPRYETTFLPVIRALAAKNVAFNYFTMYERGESFEPLPSQATHQAIPSGLVGYSYLNQLEAKLLVTTTPQLDVMTFRRSSRVDHYCNLPHALGESRFARPFAYDFFDSVLCCGPLLKQNIRKIESMRGLPQKRLLDTGLPHYDELVKSAAERKHADRAEKPRKTVLIAPSWGPMSLFTAFGTDFVRGIAERYDVVVRPHPQMKISQTDLYEKILQMKGVAIDTSPTPIDAMARADVLVSDISGIVYEYAFIHQKAVLVVDYTPGVEALEGHLLRDVTSLRTLCSDFVIAVPPSEMNNLVDRIEDVFNKNLPGRIAEARDELVYNVGHAGDVAAQQIEELLRCL